MISFVALLEGDIFSPNLWWDHSELSAHRNCCTSLCSLQIRSTGGISGFSFFLFFPLYVLLAGQLKKDKVEIFPECFIVPCPAWCTEEVGGEDEKSCGTNLALVTCNCSENRGSTEIGLQNTQAGGGRAVSFSCTSLWNTGCSTWFLFLSRKVFFTAGKASYKYSVFIILLEFIQYAELRSIKWGEGGKIPQDKRNSESCAFQNKHSTPWRGTGTVCAWLPNRGSCTSSKFVCIL